MTDVFKLHGKPLTFIRISKGKTVTDVAKALGVSAAHVSQCEKSKRKLSESKTKKFLEYIGMSVDEAKAFVQIIGE